MRLCRRCHLLYDGLAERTRRVGLANKGKKATAEMRNKMSAVAKGKPKPWLVKQSKCDLCDNPHSALGLCKHHYSSYYWNKHHHNLTLSDFKKLETKL